jgi:nucleoid-associated protein YgaU
MTSDAKIGLLLGLVFIFVIAFIINGLPNFGNRPQTAEATPMMGIQDDNLGVVDNVQGAQERLDWEQMVAQDSESLTDLQPLVGGPEGTAGMGGAETAVAAETGDVRTAYPLDELMGGVSRRFKDVVKGLGDVASKSVTLQAQSNEPAPAIEALTPSREDRRPTETVEPTQPVTRRETTRRPAATFYVVQDGDVLAAVAKKAYGPEEGNRLVNINRIFEANRNVLKSPDEIFVGQKLIIPPLPKSQADGKQPDALSEAIFEKVQDIGKRNLADMKVEQPKGRYYVVQDGDNLWKIATSQLGDGARFKEIAKLNTDVLKSNDALSIGMRLRLPTN